MENQLFRLLLILGKTHTAEAEDGKLVAILGIFPVIHVDTS
jgi:hypothetical protein